MIFKLFNLNKKKIFKYIKSYLPEINVRHTRNIDPMSITN